MVDQESEFTDLADEMESNMWSSVPPWMKYDLQLMKMDLRIAKQREAALKSLLIDKFEAYVAIHPKKPFIIFEDHVYTYEFIDQMACKVANVAKTWGLKLQDPVAILIPSEPAFIWTFLAFQKLGMSTAHINYNLKMRSLSHSIKASESRCLIVGQDESLLKNVKDIQRDLTGIDIYVQGLCGQRTPKGMTSLDPLTTDSSAIDPMIRSGVSIDDVCCFIYTSGTTGNPKPVYIPHAGTVSVGCLLTSVDFGSNDVLYLALPLYHSSGGGVGLFGVIIQGATMVLTRKFSASQLWSDCCKYDVTVIEHIGEIIRYLLHQPPNKLETSHKVRAVFGNGMKKDIWNLVKDRFNIPKIVEIYGATEGPSVMKNVADKPGAVGRLSPFLAAIDPEPKALVKFDFATATPIRDKNGRCIKVKKGEPGVFLCTESRLENQELNIYKSTKEENEKKLVRNAFKDGDAYFNYGDVLVQDNEYFLYFVDRIGDTFRWKGENVSTNEVSNIISVLDFVLDANVYGVHVPGNNGKAGMVALSLKDGHNLGEQELKKLYDHIDKELPEYAKPLFVRHLNEPQLTGNYKQNKVELGQHGYDLNKVKDPIYFRNRAVKTFSIMTASNMSTLLSSKL